MENEKHLRMLGLENNEVEWKLQTEVYLDGHLETGEMISNIGGVVEKYDGSTKGAKKLLRILSNALPNEGSVVLTLRFQCRRLKETEHDET